MISKQDYQHSISVALNKRFNDMGDYLCQLSNFKSINKDTLFELAHFIDERTYDRNTYVIRECRPVDGIYIVLQGTF